MGHRLPSVHAGNPRPDPRGSFRPERTVGNNPTAAVTAAASRAIFTALSEQLDRRRREPTAGVNDVLALREQTTLVEHFEPLASAGAHAIVQVTESDLRTCLLALTDYADRVDGEHFQPPDLRDRLQVIAQIIPVLWDANATAAAAGEPLPHAAQ